MKTPFIHRPEARWRKVLHEVIFEADTASGKAFDVALIWAILLSVTVVVLDSVRGVRTLYGDVLYFAEWFFTILFTVEYILRLISVGKPLRYAISFFGIVDLLAVMPTYLGVFLPGAHYLLTIRILRLLRIFRILKLTEYISEAYIITNALRASRKKISDFLLCVLTLVVIVGALMYIIEGEPNGYTDIPTSIYWAIVTLTTVGYGDISPQTPIGKVLACMVMIAGYGIIAVPTGIVTVELAQSAGKKISTQACPRCSAEGHDTDAKHCKKCGAQL